MRRQLRDLYGARPFSYIGRYRDEVTHPWLLPTPCTGCAIAINASGAVTINGAINADLYNSGSCSYTSNPGGVIQSAQNRAGSVLVEAGTLAASTGSITANGAYQGGRVAVHCRQTAFGDADVGDWPLSISVSTWYYSGPTGTIFVNCGTPLPRILTGYAAIPIPGGVSMQFEGIWALRTSPSSTQLVLEDGAPASSVSVVQIRSYPRGSVYSGTPVIYTNNVSALDKAVRYNPAVGCNSNCGVFASYMDAQVLLIQAPGTPLLTPDTFATVDGYYATGPRVASYTASSEPRCALACAEAAAAGCVGYTFTPHGVPVAGYADVSWGGMLSPAARHECLLFSNVTALVPSLHARTGVLRSAVPGPGGGGAAAS